MPTRVLWIGDNPTLPSLSAEAGRKICRLLASAGFEVFYYGLYRTNPPGLWEGVTLLPAISFTGDASAASGLGGPLGLSHAIDTTRPDVVVTCGRLDLFADLRYLRQIGRLTVPWHHWPAPEGRPDAGPAPAPGEFEIQTIAYPVEPVFRLLEDRSGPLSRIGGHDRFVVGSLARNLIRPHLAEVLARLDQVAADRKDLLFLWVEDLHRREVESFRQAIASTRNLRHHRAFWTDIAEDAAVLVFDLLNEHLNAMDVFLSFAPHGAVDQGALEAECTGAAVVHVSDPDWTDQIVQLHEGRKERDRAAQAARASARAHSIVPAQAWISLLEPAGPAMPQQGQGPRINWYCTVFGSGSVNHSSREMILALDRCGADLTVEQPFSRFENPVLFPDGFEEAYALHNPDEYARLERVLARRPHDPPYTTVRFIVARPEHSPYQIARSLKAPVVEYSNNDNPGRQGPDFVRQFFEGKRYFVCSEYIRDIHGASAGFPPDKISGIEVVYHGVDPAVFHPGVDPIELPTRAGFVFLNCSFPRVQHKGLDILCEAYAAEFRGERDVALVLKLPDPDKVVCPNEYADVEAVLAKAREVPGCPEIVVVKRDTPGRGDLARYYAAASAYVHPSRWEAWGISISEAVSVGLPLIATRWGGHREFIPEDMAYYVDCQPRYSDFGRSAEPDVASLRSQMRYVFEHRQEAKERAMVASRHVRENYTWDHAARRIIELLAEPASQPGRPAALLRS